MLEEAVKLTESSSSAWYAGVARLSLGLSQWEQRDRVCIPVPFYDAVGMILGNLA